MSDIHEENRELKIDKLQLKLQLKIAQNQRDELLDRLTDLWHESDSPDSLHEWIGWTKNEYARWLETGEFPEISDNEIVEIIRGHRKAHKIAMDALLPDEKSKQRVKDQSDALRRLNEEDVQS